MNKDNKNTELNINRESCHIAYVMLGAVLLTNSNKMKIVVKRNEQQPEVTIDLKDVHYPYAIRDAIQLALEIDGFTKETIAEVFNQMPDAKCEPS